MNRDEVQRILLAYRLGEAAASDPNLAEALRLAEQDPSLMVWLKQELAADRQIRERLRSIQPPPGLRTRILGARRIVVVPVWRRPSVWAAAAAVVIFVGLSGMWLANRNGATTGPSGTRGLAGGRLTLEDFRREMVRFVSSGEYSLQFQSDNLAEIRRYLASRRTEPADSFPEALEKLRTYGCQVFEWKGAEVTLVCFRAGNAGIAHVLAVDARAFRDPPALERVIGAVDTWSVASWRKDERVFLVCAATDTVRLRSLLGG